MVLSYAKAEEIGLDSRRLQTAYSLLQQWTEGADAPVPGGAILVGRNGKCVEPQFFGRQGPEPDAPPIRRDAAFLLASLTKPVTYIAGMILVERGLLGLSDLVAKYVNGFGAHHKDETTVQQLFTHTSGLPDMVANNTELRRQHAPLERFVDAVVRETVPLFPPGTDFKYQSMGTLMVAEIVRRISGLTIHEFARKEIFEPLGLKATSFGARGISPERLVRNQTPVGPSTNFDWNSSYWRELGAPWGGMFSTPEEFAVICQLMLNGGVYENVRILARTTVQLMTTNRLDDHPEVPASVRLAKPWGLGWQMNHPGHGTTLCEILGRNTYGHLGATGTLCWMNPETNGFCVLLTSYERDRAPWRLLRLSNAVAAAFIP